MKKKQGLLKILGGKQLKAKKLSDEKLKKLLNSMKEKIVEHKNLKCPSCKSDNTVLREKRDSNHVIGTGYRSWVTDSYYVCQECGTRFEDVSKLKK